MHPKIDVITLGAMDLEQARPFYEKGLGTTVRAEADQLRITLGGEASEVVLRDWDSVALGGGVKPTTRGFRAFTLSYILESAHEVDQILKRAESSGARVSKSPKNAVWGYSAYLTDPSGYLWKVASSKRRPLFAKEEAGSRNGNPITAKEVPITIGVADMKRAKEFYKDGLGLPVKKAFGNKFVMFSGEGRRSDLGMYKREALAADAAVQPEGSGFHGFCITHAAESREQVDTLLAGAERAGGEIRKPATIEADGAYGGCFADLDGNLWQVTFRS